MNEIMRVSGALIDKLWLIVALLVKPGHAKSMVSDSTLSNFH